MEKHTSMDDHASNMTHATTTDQHAATITDGSTDDDAVTKRDASSEPMRQALQKF
jgi:hypothetical protein